MARRLIECVPNFSEGRNRRTVDAIVDVVSREPGVAVLSHTMDADHNRSVITFAGDPDRVAAAAIRAVAKAIDLIDLNNHTGVHPRIGAADVVPFVPIEGITLQDCALLARGVGEEIWKSLRVPVYLYEAAAQRPDRINLEDIRRGQFERLRNESHTNPQRIPDVGGPQLHSTAGAVVVGARKFLIAFNVNLHTSDISVATRIARAIRTSSGGLPHVKALGFHLASRNLTQVSMNLTDFESTPVHVVYEAIRSLAETYGVSIAGSEIIGLVPKAVLECATEYFLKVENFQSDVVFENRLNRLLPPR